MEYIRTSDEILLRLCQGYDNIAVSHNTSAMLRSSRQTEAEISFHSQCFLQGVPTLRVISQNCSLLRDFQRFLQIYGMSLF